MSDADRRIPLTILVAAQVGAMALWFSASAVVPAMSAEVALSDTREALFTSLVQLGFVVGTLISAALTLPDRIDPRRLFLIASLIGAAANAGVVWVGPAADAALVMRFVTGACMAGIYPVGMKMASTWARGDMGLVVGLLVGALTLGSASPHLISAAGGEAGAVDWRLTMIAASAMAVVSGVMISGLRLGPNIAPAPPFRPSLMLEAWRSVPIRLANLGYLGHMWELYAMWAWIVVFLKASFTESGLVDAVYWASIAAFVTVGVGAAGSVVAGRLADLAGRTTVTMAAMAVSGACAVAIGYTFGGPEWIVVAVCVVWGVAIVADSAQFSASIAELADRGLVGTMLTVQTSTGFLLTMITIHMIPYLVDGLSWRYAFAVLAIGPALGCLAMWRLRHHPDASRLAGGRR